MTIKTSTSLLAVVALAAGFGTLSVAQDGVTDRLPTSVQAIDRQFDEMDTNSDGRLTPDEINPELRLHRDFSHHDVDNSGAIELDEFRNYVRNAREKQH